MTDIDPIRDAIEALNMMKIAREELIGAIVFAHDHDGMTFRAIAAAIGKPTTFVFNAYRKASE